MAKEMQETEKETMHEFVTEISKRSLVWELRTRDFDYYHAYSALLHSSEQKDYTLFLSYRREVELSKPYQCVNFSRLYKLSVYEGDITNLLFTSVLQMEEDCLGFSNFIGEITEHDSPKVQKLFEKVHAECQKREEVRYPRLERLLRALKK